MSRSSLVPSFGWLHHHRTSLHSLLRLASIAQFAVEASPPPDTYLDDFLAAAIPAIMSLDPPTYLASLQSNIRQRPIPWEGAVRAGTLTEDQHAKIRAADKAKNSDQKRQIVEGDLDGYRLLLVGGDGKPSVLETASKQPNVIQYIWLIYSKVQPSQTPPRKMHCLFKGSCIAQLSLPSNVLLQCLFILRERRG